MHSYSTAPAPLPQKDFDQEIAPQIGNPLCRLQLQQLVQSVSALAGWIAYQREEDSSASVVSYHRQAVEQLDAEQLAWLTSGAIVETITPTDRLQALALGNGTTAYIGLPQESVNSGIRYVLLWCDRTLSTPEIERLEHQIEILSQSLQLEHRCRQQETQINRLKQSLARIEHQLRNPLALIHLYTQNLYRSLGKEPEQAQALLIRDAASDVINHLSEVIQSSQQGSLKVNQCDLKTVFEESIQGYQLLIQEKQIQVDYPKTRFDVWADQAQLKQVLDNLLHNALCFSPLGATVTCAWQGFQKEVLITIADQGSGLSPTDLQRMFEPYYTNRPGGTGLGLPIALKIVRQHHGDLWANNLAQGGTQFSMSLPRQPI